MGYELWDTETRNLVAAFESEAEALQAARQFITMNSEAYPNALALVLEDEQGESTLVARGVTLANRSRNSTHESPGQ
ncbi:MAG: hypothetical protein AB7P40_28050 [Chloroflexota bacterium]